MAEHLVLANTALKRLRGLLGRRALAPGEGLWLRPCNSVHTFWMLFAIDVIFLDRQLRIVKLVENLKPFRMTLPVRGTTSIIEIAAYSISHHKLQVGDILHIEK